MPAKIPQMGISENTVKMSKSRVAQNEISTQETVLLNVCDNNACIEFFFILTNKMFVILAKNL